MWEACELGLNASALSRVIDCDKIFTYNHTCVIKGRKKKPIKMHYVYFLLYESQSMDTFSQVIAFIGTYETIQLNITIYIWPKLFKNLTWCFCLNNVSPS